MRVIARSTLSKFVETLAGRKDAVAIRTALEAWFHETELAAWKNSQDIKRAYATASIVGAERVVFNIKGNSYRLIVSIDYPRQTVFIKWLGSHKDYDSIDARTVEYGDQTYQKRSGSR
jgi:mRNA interferase HigB